MKWNTHWKLGELKSTCDFGLVVLTNIIHSVNFSTLLEPRSMWNILLVSMTRKIRALVDLKTDLHYMHKLNILMNKFSTTAVEQEGLRY